MAGALLALAAVGLAYEVALTRLFSLIFQYHYVFLIVSLAVLGLGIGAAIGHMTRSRADGVALGGAAIALGVALIGVAIALASIRSASRIALAAGLGLVPFVLLNATIFARYARIARCFMARTCSARCWGWLARWRWLRRLARSETSWRCSRRGVGGTCWRGAGAV